MQFKPAALAFTIIASTTAFATDISRLDPGDIVYKTGFTGVLAPDKVEVVRVEVSSNEVKVRDLESGVTEWVSANDLYTADELSSARVGATVSSVVAAGESMNKTQTSRVAVSCMADTSFQEEVVSRAIVEYASAGITAEGLCECLARKIVESETWDTSDAIARDFGNLRNLDRSSVESRLNSCVATSAEAAQATSVAATPESSATFVEPTAEPAAFAAEASAAVEAAPTDDPAISLAIDDVDAAALAAAAAANQQVSPTPSSDAAAKERDSRSLPLMLLGVAGALGAGVLIGRKWSAAGGGQKN